MLEALYKYYFKLVSIRPFGALDLKIRRFTGVLFNGASNRSELSTIQHLAQNRQDAIGLLTRGPGVTPEQLPCVDIIIVVKTLTSKLQATFDALGQQSYPHDKITLTVLLPENHKGVDKPSLPDHFLHSSYVEIAGDIKSSAYTAVLNKLKAPYFLLMASPLVFHEDSLELLMQGCISSPPATALWEASPTLRSRTLYYDPVTLEIPCSFLEVGIVKRESFDKVSGFDDRFPISGQGLDLAYQLRAGGFRLKNIGQPGHFEQSLNSNGPLSPDGQHERQITLNLVRSKYGNWFQKVLASLRLSWLQGGEYEISLGSTLELNRNALSEHPKVSIIIRTFAGRGYWLRESVCSVLNQTYPNLELIVVEDGSAEQNEFMDVVSATLRQGQTLKHLTQEKKGKSHAGNLGLAAAEGQFIGFLDDDDLLFANHVELLVELSLSDENMAGAYALAWEVQTAAKPGQGYSEEHYEVPRFTRRAFSRKALEKHNIWPIQSVLFSRSLYDQYGGFDTERVFLEDWELWLRYTQNAEFAYLPHITSMYRTPADPYLRVARVSNTERRVVS